MISNSFFNQALTILDQLYPPNSNYQPTVSLERQLEEIQALKNLVNYEQFFFVLNLMDRKIEHCYGVNKWLGFPDHVFNLFDYFKIIHPRHLGSLNMLAKSAFETANSNEFKLRFMGQKVIIQIPLLNSRGKYLLTKRTLYPFQIDESGKVLSYLNHFVILKDYEDADSLEPRISGYENMDTKNELNVLNTKRNSILSHEKKPFGFNRKELSILRLISENPRITHSEIGDQLNLSVETLKKTYNHRILTKARESFDSDNFTSLKEVALFLKKEGIF